MIDVNLDIYRYKYTIQARGRRYFRKGAWKESVRVPKIFYSETCIYDINLADHILSGQPRLVNTNLSH